MGPIESLGLIFGFLLLSLIAHEFGHIIVLSSKTKYTKDPVRIIFNREKNKSLLGRKSVWSIGKPEHYESLTTKEEFDVYFAGIFGGFLPIAILLLSYSINLYVGLTIIVTYLYGCKSDIKQIKQIWRNKQNEKNNSNDAPTYN